MKTEYVIYWISKDDNHPERVDQTDTPEDAAFLVTEYRMAYGGIVYYKEEEEEETDES